MLRGWQSLLALLALCFAAYLAFDMSPLQIAIHRAVQLPRIIAPFANRSSLAYKNLSNSLSSPATGRSTNPPSTSFTTNHHHHHFSTSTANMSSSSFREAASKRRTVYQLQNKSTISDERIKEIVTDAIKYVPSSFDSQSTRLVVLVKEEHEKFWDTTTAILKAHVPEGQWEHTAQRMSGFRNAYGSILFYEDPTPIKALQSKLPTYADRFPVWSEHTSAMHQYYLWTALEAEGLGASLQHYNPLPDQKASEIWEIPLEWSLKAQLVFGEPAAGWQEKLPKRSVEPLEKKVFFHGL